MHNIGAQMAQVVVFELAGQEYGVNVDNVLEIIRPEAISRIPGAPGFIEGVIKLRGRVIPVYNVAGRFGLTRAGARGGECGGERDENSKIIIVEAGGTTVGMIVDSVAEVRQFAGDQIEPPPEIVTGRDNAYLKGIVLVDERLIILLDVERLLYEREKEALAEAAASFQSIAAE